jgi:hypothetical protein
MPGPVFGEHVISSRALRGFRPRRSLRQRGSLGERQQLLEDPLVEVVQLHEQVKAINH